MRSALIAILGVVGLAAAANAAPAMPGTASQHDSNIVTVAGGCGPGFHPTSSGRCMPFRHAYRGWRSYGGSDFSADELNARELGRINGY